MLEDKARAFGENGKSDSTWAFNGILKFIQFQKERFDHKEITAGTIRNYVKSIKLFCQMADILVPWDKITRGLPRGSIHGIILIRLLFGHKSLRINKMIRYPHTNYFCFIG
jgi:hypothetical protein